VALAPGLWTDWLAFLSGSSDVEIRYLPLWLRLPIAVALVVWGALRGRRGLLAVAMVFAMPLWSAGVLLLLAAVPRLRLGTIRGVDSVAVKPLTSAEAGSEPGS
jgi:hypothetical protein